mmetsp:Transcript_26997/g.45534  ORF Transcript_26997/g.45534 Transcript_26997/m.45534 type:complete len:123 (+) Transcript_26997:1513-1881(+)
MPKLRTLVETYHAQVVFAFVYILEAHAVDEWPVPCNNKDIKQHRSLLDRAAAARRMMAELSLPAEVKLLLDSEQNEFNSTYSSWPFRYWIIHRGVLQCKMMPEADLVSMEALDTWLQNNIRV